LIWPFSSAACFQLKFYQFCPELASEVMPPVRKLPESALACLENRCVLALKLEEIAEQSNLEDVNREVAEMVALEHEYYNPEIADDFLPSPELTPTPEDIAK
jgi:hypothetical protein